MNQGFMWVVRQKKSALFESSRVKLCYSSALFFVSQIFSSAPFFILMKLGVVFSFLKMMYVAAFASVNVFSEYALFLSLAYFLGYGLSLGIVEGSVKAFPRLVAENDIKQVYFLAKKVILRLFANSLLLFLFLAALSSVLQISLFQAFILVILALVGAITSLVASVHRAIDQPTKMALGNFSRAFITFVFVVAVSFYSNFVSFILIAEVFGGVAGALISARLAGVKLYTIRPRIEPSQSMAMDQNNWGGLDKGGRFVAIGYLLNSVPFYLDKWMANFLLSESESTVYIYAATLLTVAVVIMNTLSQLVGARLIKLVQLKSSRLASRHALNWIIAGVITWGLLVIGYYFLSEWQLLPDSLSKYKLSLELLFLLFVLGALYSSQLFEFLVIGLDLESRFFQASMTHILLLALLLTAVFVRDGGITGLMLALIVSRAFYLTLIFVFLSSTKSE